MEAKKRESYYNPEHQKKYMESKKRVMVGFNLKKQEDVELFEHLESVDDKTNYIKTLIRKDMNS